VAPGNAGDRAGRAPLARALAAKGLAVLLLDYRGYGGNPGRPTEEGLARDVRAARSFLIGDIGIQPDRLLYYGESLGGAVVTELATEHPPGGMLLRSPFTDLASAGQVHYSYLPLRALLWDSYPVARQLAQLKVPVSVVYGTADSVVLPSQSRDVAAAVPVLRRMVAINGADHNDRILLDGDALVEAVVDLAEHVA
jgi:pimeloyl-ACP methyl ester carboxylesterase